MKRVFIDVRRCTGCKSCELACAVEHSESKDLFLAVFETPSPVKRIHVEQVQAFSYPSRCMHCEEASCMIACPSGAMDKDKSGAVVVNEARCMGCMMCAMVCPFGAITMNRASKVIIKCDFCITRKNNGKLPACVEACPTGTLQYGEEEDLVRSKRIVAGQAVIKAVCAEKERLSETNPLEIFRKLGGI